MTNSILSSARCSNLFKIFLFTLLISVFCNETKAQNAGILRGFVADSLTGEALPYANIVIKELNRGATTDNRGYFVIASLPYKRISVIVSFIGYTSKTFSQFIEPNKVNEIKAQLVSSSIQLRAIETVGERVNKENELDLSLKKITIRDLETLPKGVELDIFRSIQSLSGVQTGGDVSARYYVRGSASNENLVQIDNAPVYNPFHALGIFSSLDPDIISSMEFYKGGFPAEFSNRLSSVLKVVTKDGNKNNFGAKAAASLLTAKVFVEGPIPSGSFILSGRKNYSDVVLKKFRNNNTIPADFYDIFAKVNYSDDVFMEDAKFSLSAFISSDKIMNGNIKREDFKWSNNVFSFNYFQVSDSPLFYQLDISLSNFEGERIPNESGGKGIKNSITDMSMRVDFNYIFESKDELNGGFKFSEVNTKLSTENFRGQSFVSETKGVSVSAYVKYKFLRFNWLGADLGARIHGTRLAGGGTSSFVEPRASLTIRPIPEFAIKGSWGIFMQDLVTVSDENEVVTIFEPWIITPLYLKPSNALHYIAGIEINPSANLTFELEGYLKYMQNLAVVNDQKYFETDPDLISGSGRAYGFEFQSKYMLAPFTFNGSYSLMYAFKNIRGVEFAPRYDSRHNINLSLEISLGAGWAVSGAWTYTTGLPFTQIAGYYDKLSFDQLGGNTNMLESYNPFVLLADMNKGKLPDYHRLDLSISKKLQISFVKLSVDFSVLNAYDRDNLFYFRRDNGERVNMLPFLPSVNIKAEL